MNVLQVGFSYAEGFLQCPALFHQLKRSPELLGIACVRQQYSSEEFPFFRGKPTWNQDVHQGFLAFSDVVPLCLSADCRPVLRARIRNVIMHLEADAQRFPECSQLFLAWRVKPCTNSCEGGGEAVNGACLVAAHLEVLAKRGDFTAVVPRDVNC